MRLKYIHISLQLVVAFKIEEKKIIINKIKFHKHETNSFSMPSHAFYIENFSYHREILNWFQFRSRSKKDNILLLSLVLKKVARFKIAAIRCSSNLRMVRVLCIFVRKILTKIFVNKRICLLRCF